MENKLFAIRKMIKEHKNNCEIFALKKKKTGIVFFGDKILINIFDLTFKEKNLKRTIVFDGIVVEDIDLFDIMMNYQKEINND